MTSIAVFCGLISLFHGTFGLTCLECSDVPNARDCNTVKECGPHEVCYSSQIVSTSGHIYRQLGCRDRLQCGGTLVGKRSLQVREAGDLPICDSCCDTPWCQANVCQDVPYASDKGLICYQCKDQMPEENCTHIEECSRDSSCYESYKRTISGHVLRQTGCFNKLLCQRVQASSNFHLTNETCWKCCDSDICNTSCDNKKPPTPSKASVTVSPGSGSGTGGCVDSTPYNTCQIASGIVCADITHAKNANCMHYCGFC